MSLCRRRPRPRGGDSRRRGPRHPSPAPAAPRPSSSSSLLVDTELRLWLNFGHPRARQPGSRSGCQSPRTQSCPGAPPSASPAPRPPSLPGDCPGRSCRANAPARSPQPREACSPRDGRDSVAGSRLGRGRHPLVLQTTFLPARLALRPRCSHFSHPQLGSRGAAPVPFPPKPNLKDGFNIYLPARERPGGSGRARREATALDPRKHAHPPRHRAAARNE